MIFGIFACQIGNIGIGKIEPTVDVQATVDAAISVTEQAKVDIATPVKATVDAMQQDDATEEMSTGEPAPEVEKEAIVEEITPAKLILAGCNDSFLLETDQPIELEYGHWIVREAYLEANRENLSVTLFIDDQEVEGAQQPPAPDPDLSALCLSGDLTEDSYIISYKAQLDPLAAGEYMVKYVMSFDEEVSDGFDLNDDGVLDIHGPGPESGVTYLFVVQD